MLSTVPTDLSWQVCCFVRLCVPACMLTPRAAPQTSLQQTWDELQRGAAAQAQAAQSPTARAAPCPPPTPKLASAGAAPLRGANTGGACRVHSLCAPRSSLNACARVHAPPPRGRQQSVAVHVGDACVAPPACARRAARARPSVGAHVPRARAPCLARPRGWSADCTRLVRTGAGHGLAVPGGRLSAPAATQALRARLAAARWNAAWWNKNARTRWSPARAGAWHVAADAWAASTRGVSVCVCSCRR
jgi:hypothetical protein